MKSKIFYVVILSIMAFNIVTAFSPDTNKIDYSFEKKFNSTKIKNQLSIKLVRDLDGFEFPLSECLDKFYIDTLGVKTYQLADRNKKNKISVSEYIFKDTISAYNAFRLAFPYAESVRKTRLKDWATMCFTMPIPQVYYASRDGSHVYLYTTIYNFSYRSREDSIDALIQRDKRILLDNLYGEIIHTK